MTVMAGLVDFFRAVYGTVRLALRRIHPLAGPVVVAVIWVMALGGALLVTRDDPSSSPVEESAASTDRDRDGTRDVDRDDGEAGGDDDLDADGSPSTTGDDEDGGDGTADGGVDPADGDGDGAGGEGGGSGGGSTLESPGGPGRVTTPTSGRPDPSWLEPEPPATTTTTGPSTTAPPTSGPTTSTTVPPSGGLLGDLLRSLFGG